MRLASWRFGRSQIMVQLGSDAFHTMVYYYETKSDVYDVIVSPHSGRFMCRKNDGEWFYAPEPIHEAIVRHFELEGEFRGNMRVVR